MSSIAYPLGQDLEDPNIRRLAGGGQGVRLMPDVPVPDYAATGGIAVPAAPQQNQSLAGAALTTPPTVKGFGAIAKPALNLNPQLPQVAAANMGGPADSTYSASEAQLRAEISQKYNDVLKQLGYMDPSTGQFVMGRVETDAQRQATELQRSVDLAREAETLKRQGEGTLFSGRRATEQARAEHPFVQSLADLDINVPQQLSDLYEQAGNTVSDYTLRNNLLLAELAQRRAAGAMNAPAGPGPAAPPGTPPGGPDLPKPVAPPTYTDPYSQGALAGSGLSQEEQDRINANYLAMMQGQVNAGQYPADEGLIYYNGQR